MLKFSESQIPRNADKYPERILELQHFSDIVNRMPPSLLHYHDVTQSLPMTQEVESLINSVQRHSVRN